MFDIAMDCRKFHKNLEDYLQDGLDFSGRFGMERHAQQCIGCEKDLADAQRLSRMASALERVKAPLDFEASVLQEIGKRKSHGRFSYLYRTWVYGFDSFPWRKLALVGCSCAALSLGLVYWPRHTPVPIPAVIPNSSPAPSYVAAGQTKAVGSEIEKPVAAVHESAKPQALPTIRFSKTKSEIQPPNPALEEPFTERETADTEYMDYVIEGPDNRTEVVRLPKAIRMQYGHATPEYFIRNVSH